MAEISRALQIVLVVVCIVGGIFFTQWPRQDALYGGSRSADCASLTGPAKAGIPFIDFSRSADTCLYGTNITLSSAGGSTTNNVLLFLVDFSTGALVSVGISMGATQLYKRLRHAK